MNKKTIITIITILVIAVAASMFFGKTPKVTPPVEETSPRNDMVTEATTTTENVVKSYSLAEVALHDKKEDCWTVIDGNVINPTQFIAEGKHPNDYILKACGIDATTLFKSVPKHKGPTPQEALAQYKIGVLK